MPLNGHSHANDGERFAREMRSRKSPAARKERAAQGLSAQPAPVRAALDEMLARNLTYVEIGAELLKQFGVKTNPSALHRYREALVKNALPSAQTQPQSEPAAAPDQEAATVIVIRVSGAARVEIHSEAK